MRGAAKYIVFALLLLHTACMKWEYGLVEGADDSEWAQDWTKWDLSSLGAVTKIALHMEEAQSVTYDSVTYYYCSPLFFAIDDITVRFEE